MKRRRAVFVLTLSGVLAFGSVTAAEAEAAARRFGNCVAMRAAYPGGVAKSQYAATHPTPSWIKIKTPAVDSMTYDANRRLDRDGDGIACELAR